MPSVVTHAWIPLKSGADGSAAIPKGGTPPKGFIEGYTGKSVDPSEPPAIELFGVFDSKASAAAAREAPEAKAHMEALLAAADPSHPAAGKALNAFELAGADFAAVAAAAVVQLSVFFVPTGRAAAFDAAFQALTDGRPPVKPAGLVAAAHGWGLEQVEVAGVQHRVFLMAAGWQSTASAEAERAAAEAAAAGLVEIAKPRVRFTVLTKQEVGLSGL